MSSHRPLAGRLRALDGLRGLAAVVVVVHHSLLVVPTLAAPHFDGRATTWWAALLVYSPLHLFWAGTEAVFLFFVLSGVVLGRAAANPQFDWSRYVPARLVRLYLPVLGAVLVGVLTFRLVGREPFPGMSEWLARLPTSYPLQGILQDSMLVTGVSRSITPLWTLQWEVLFSLLLGGYIFIAVRASPVLQVMTAILLSALGYATGVVALYYLPMFAIGTAIGAHWVVVEQVGRRINSHPLSRFIWPLAAAVAAVLVCSYWLLLPVFDGPPDLRLLSLPLILVGVTLVVLVAASWTPFASVLSLRPIQWLGAISFSLYLVHEPVIVAFAFASHGSAVWGAIAGVVAFLAAQLFMLVMERPAHRLSRRIARPRSWSE